MRLFPLLVCAYGSSVTAGSGSGSGTRTGISWKRKLAQFRGGSSGPPEYGSYQGQQPPLPPDLPPFDDDDPYNGQMNTQNDPSMPPQHQLYAEGPPPPPPLPDGPVDQFNPPYSAFADEPDLDDDDDDDEALRNAQTHQAQQEASIAWDSPSSTTASKEPVVDLSVFDKDYILKGLARLYRKKILPLELASRYGHFQSPPLSPSDFDAPPMILLLGQYSVGTLREQESMQYLF
jgi:hypothetical protein